MKQKNVKRKITLSFLLSLGIMLIASGCGKPGYSSLDLNSYITESSSEQTADNESLSDIPGAENTLEATNSPNNTDMAESGNQTANNGTPDMINSVTLAWSAPSLNSDGSPLADDLDGYIIYYGQGSGNYSDSVDIGNFTSASVNDLTYGTWCFAVTSYDSAGNESDLSAETCKTIS